jgi:hypothetical protein
MRRNVSARISPVVLTALTLAGCVGGRSGLATVAVPSPATSQPPGPVTLADKERCPATRPSRVGPHGVSPTAFFGWESSYGNRKLWVGGLWPNGVIKAGPEFVTEDGSVSIKFGWWRAVTGDLRIEGRRLDATSPPLQVRVPFGYGETGFQSSGVFFPTEGCWEVTGSVGRTTLTFVTFVVKQGA